MPGVIQETYSAYNENSFYEPRNIDYRLIFLNLSKTNEFSDHLIITDSGLAMPMYAAINITPDRVLDFKNININGVYNYTNTPLIYYEDLKKIDQPSIVVLFTRTKYFIRGNNI